MNLQPQGKLLHASTVPGQTRADDVFPAHPGGCQLSKDRFLILAGMRGWRGTDEDLSIIYQLRKDAWTGPILAEGCVQKTIDDWDPYNDGSRFAKLHGQPQAFGVPKGAHIDGNAPEHANLFVLKWRSNARLRLPGTGTLALQIDEPLVTKMKLLQGVEWCHFKLNDAEDDIELLTPVAKMRQVGYEDGDQLCASGSRWMNHGMAQPVPSNRSATEWIECDTFDPGGGGYDRMRVKIATVRFAYNAQTKRYKWVETGPLVGLDESSLVEASIMPWRDDWLIVARTEHRKHGATVPGPIWLRTNDPFSKAPTLALPETLSHGPIAAYRCGDGRVRMLCNAPRYSRGHKGRDPLFCFDVDPDNNFAYSEPATVLSTIAAGLPLRPESMPVADMAKILPHAGGDQQILLHRVRTVATYEGKTGVFVNDEEKQAHGIHCCVMQYDQPLPPPWTFK